MKFQSSITVANSSATEMVLHLEPWGEQFMMSPTSTLSITAKAEQAGAFEIEHLDNEMIVLAWPSASVEVFSGDVEVDIARTIPISSGS